MTNREPRQKKLEGPKEIHIWALQNQVHSGLVARGNDVVLEVPEPHSDGTLTFVRKSLSPGHHYQEPELFYKLPKRCFELPTMGQLAILVDTFHKNPDLEFFNDLAARRDPRFEDESFPSSTRALSTARGTYFYEAKPGNNWRNSSALAESIARKRNGVRYAPIESEESAIFGAIFGEVGAEIVQDHLPDTSRSYLSFLFNSDSSCDPAIERYLNLGLSLGGVLDFFDTEGALKLRESSFYAMVEKGGK